MDKFNAMFDRAKTILIMLVGSKLSAIVGMEYEQAADRAKEICWMLIVS